MRKISESTFVINANGFADGPSQALRDYLIKSKAKRVITISHPLGAESAGVHIVSDFQAGESTEKKIKLFNKPPYTFLFDLFIPLKLPESTLWFGFNNLACVRGLIRRKFGRTDTVAYWAVDFVPERFGKSIVSSAYKKLDKFTAKHADARIELSPVGVTKRNEYLGLNAETIAPTQVVPMGAWLDRTAKVSKLHWGDHRIVFLGHLVPRQGVGVLLEALKILKKENISVCVDIVGGGPLEKDLREQSKDLGLQKIVTFHGFVKEHKDVEDILANGTFAVAPYVEADTNFVQFSDAGKLKAYLGAYLPIILTDVPNNAQDLQKAGAALITQSGPAALAASLKQWLGSESDWVKAHLAAKKVAQEFDWNNILSSALHKLDLE